MNGSRIASLLVAVLMTASLLYVTSGVIAYDAEMDEASIEESTVDSDGDGRINYLVISVPIDVVDVDYGEHTYIYGELRNSLGPEIIEIINVSVSISTSFTGTMWVDLDFNGRLINASGIDGPYEVYLEHVYRDMPWPYPYFVVETYTYDTEAYVHDDFETPDPYEIEEISWVAIDDDDNDLYDWLQINVTVNATDGDIVVATVEWQFECSDTIATTESEHVISVSEDQEISARIDGRILNGFDRQNVQYYVIVSIETSDGYTNTATNTSLFYNATDFEPYALTIVGDIGWEPMDVNNDGLTDFLKVFYNVTVTTTDKYRIQTDIDDVNVTHFGADNFEGYLIEGYEETIITFIDSNDLYDEGMPGPYNITIHEDSMAFGKWPSYESIENIPLGNLTIESFDLNELNHPEMLYVSGYILDEEGLPMNDADVDFQSTNLTWLWGNDGQLTTGEDGMYNFTEAMPGLLNIRVSNSSYFDKSVTITDFDSNTAFLNITLEERNPENSTIVGTVFDAANDPVLDAWLILVRIGSGPGPCNETTVDAGGNYTLNVKEGDYLLLAFWEDPAFWDRTNFTYAYITVSANETVWLNMTLNQTHVEEDELSMSGSMLIDMPDWNSLDMVWDIDLPSFDAVYFEILARYADIDYGNADGYIDEAEAEIFTDIFVAEEDMGDRMGAQSGLYALDSFSVDGIGYYAPPAAIDFALLNITGPAWNLRDDVSMLVTFSSTDAYWEVPDADSHSLYMEVDYNSPESDISEMVLEVVAPTGYILTGTNDPANITIEGLNNVIVTPGGLPDPEAEYSSALVILTFSRETGEDNGSIHGYAVLEDETDYSGIEVELLDGDLEVLDNDTTGSTGEFAFLDLEPGYYHLRGSMTGYNDAFASATVVAGVMSEVELILLPEGSVLEPGSIAGTVVTQAGLPIADALVELYTPADNDTLLNSSETLANGTFEFGELDTGEYRLEISAEGFTDKTVIVLLNVDENRDLGDIELISDSPVGYVTGILQDVDESPIAGVTVEVRASGSDGILVRGSTDSTGTFLIVGLEDGDYNLTFVLDGTVIGHAEVTVVDFVGDAGTIVIDLASIDFEDDELPWLWILLILAVLAIVGVAAAMKMRKPKPSQPMKFEEPTADTEAVEEELPPPPPEY